MPAKSYGWNEYLTNLLGAEQTLTTADNQIRGWVNAYPSLAGNSEVQEIGQVVTRLLRAVYDAQAVAYTRPISSYDQANEDFISSTVAKFANDAAAFVENLARQQQNIINGPNGPQRPVQSNMPSPVTALLRAWMASGAAQLYDFAVQWYLGQYLMTGGGPGALGIISMLGGGWTPGPSGGGGGGGGGGSGKEPGGGDAGAPDPENTGGAGGGGASGGGGTGGGPPLPPAPPGGKPTIVDQTASNTGTPIQRPYRGPGNAGKVIGDVIVRPNQKVSDGGGVDWWLGLGDGGGGGGGDIAEQIQQIAQELGKGKGKGKGPITPGQSGPGRQPTPTTSPQAPPGYDANNNADPYGGQGQETDRSGTSRESSDRQAAEAAEQNKDKDANGGPVDTKGSGAGTGTEGSGSGAGASSGSGGSGSGSGTGSTNQPQSGPDPGSAQPNDPNKKSMPDPDSDGGGEGPSFTPGFHFTPHGGNTGGAGAPDPIDTSWSPEGRSDPFSAWLAGAGGGGGDDWGGNNPRFDPGELADPETSGRYRGNDGYKPDPETTGPGNPHSKAGKAATSSKASRFIVATRLSRLNSAARNIRFG